MLELTNAGLCCSGLDALELFEMLPDMIPDEVKTEDFCDDYEAALNRIRCLVRADLPQQPKLHPGIYSTARDYETCPHCGRTISKACGRPELCDNCGQRFDWSGVTDEYIKLHRQKERKAK